MPRMGYSRRTPNRVTRLDRGDDEKHQHDDDDDEMSDEYTTPEGRVSTREPLVRPRIGDGTAGGRPDASARDRNSDRSEEYQLAS